MLTETQIATLRAVVLAESSLDTARATGDDYAIAAWCNANASPAYQVWNTQTATQAIADSVTWSNLTPLDAADGTTTFTNRALVAQAKQLNLQIFLQGREFLSTGKPNIRSGLQDSLTNLPTGASGALISGGWATVKNVIQRPARNAEKILASGSGTSASPSTLTFEGLVTPDEASLLR